jgi:hypothetical protein
MAYLFILHCENCRLLSDSSINDERLTIKSLYPNLYYWIDALVIQRNLDEIAEVLGFFQHRDMSVKARGSRGSQFDKI